MGFHRVIETDRRGVAVTGDTLFAYVAHFAPGQPINGGMLAADLLIMCYPDELPQFLRERHALPEATGLIFVSEYYDVPLFVVFPDNDRPEWVTQLEERGDLDLPVQPGTGTEQ